MIQLNSHWRAEKEICTHPLPALVKLCRAVQFALFTNSFSRIFLNAMIKHLVFWKFKPEANGRSARENAVLLREQLLALKQSIPQILEIDCGVDFNASPAAFDFGLHTAFASKEDLEIYQRHPEHLKIKELVGQITADRAVVDYVC